MYRNASNLIFIFIFLIGCQTQGRRGDDAVALSESLLAANPDSALAYIDSVWKQTGSGRLDKSAQIRLLLVRQKAFAQKRMMDSVIASGVLIRSLAAETGDSLSMARSLLPVRGEVSMADQKNLEPYLPGAARTFKAAGMVYEEAVIEGLNGAIGTRKGDFAAAMGHLYRARDILEGLDSIRPLYAVYMNIGSNRSAMGDHRASIGFYEKAADVARKMGDSVRIASALMNEGIARSDMGGYDSSRIRLNDALASLPVHGGDMARLQILYNLATVSERLGIYSAAESDFRQVLAGATAMGDPVAIGMANSGLAGILGKTGRLGEAIDLMEGAVRRLDSVGLGHYSIDLSKNLVLMYKRAGRNTEALAASERLMSLNDSLLSADKQKAVRELEAKYNYDRQEEEKRDLIQKLRLNRLVAVGFALAALSLAVVGIVLRQRNRFHRELVKSYDRMLSRYRQERDAEEPESPRTSWHLPGEAGEADPMEDGMESMALPVFEPTMEERRVYEGLIEHFSKEKPYLVHRLRLEDMAQSNGMPVRRFSQLIKAMTGQTFNQFVNRYRIDEATRLMENPDTRHWKIETIAEKSGFASRQQFRRIFEQVTGVNPGYYRSRNDGQGNA